MRTLLMASAALLAATLAMPAMAQTTTTDEPTMGGQTQATPGGDAMSGQSMPSDTVGGEAAQGTRHRSMQTRAAAALPADGTPEEYLTHAQRAVQQRQGTTARDALERAETRLLDRSATPAAAGQPQSSPALRSIQQAREAVARRDWQTASQAVNEAMSGARMATTSPATTTSGAMGQGTSAQGTMSGGAAPMTPSVGGAPDTYSNRGPSGTNGAPTGIGDTARSPAISATGEPSNAGQPAGSPQGLIGGGAGGTNLQDPQRSGAPSVGGANP